MAINLTVPPFGESVTEAVIARWYVQEGDIVAKDQPICEIESDKANQDLPSPATGRIVAILKKADDSVSVGEVIGHLEPMEGAEVSSSGGDTAGTGEEAQPGAAEPEPEETPEPARGAPATGPAVRRLLAEHHLSAEEITATGPGGRITKADVLSHLAREETQAEATPMVPGAARSVSPAPTPGSVSGSRGPARPAEPSPPRERPPAPPAPAPGVSWTPPADAGGSSARTAGREERVKMSPLRKKVAQRLVEVQHSAAILTTFNEVDMSAVMALRKRYQKPFQEKYGIKLGFMSFFVKACIEALKAYPGVNAEIRGDEIVYKHYYDIGVAVGGGKGLVVPVIRDADRMSFAEVELAIAALAEKARKNRLSLEELSGGTFTISNGGIYGSLMSTPILNPPQSGILGMHKIMDRPVVEDGQVVVRPMMYLALSYDHRVIDGREAVSFLVRVKECIEGPERILLEV